jgi:hypothetical protein
MNSNGNSQIQPYCTTCQENQVSVLGTKQPMASCLSCPSVGQMQLQTIFGTAADGVTPTSDSYGRCVPFVDPACMTIDYKTNPNVPACTACYPGYFLQMTSGSTPPVCNLCKDNTDIVQSNGKPYPTPIPASVLLCMSCGASDLGKNCSLCSQTLPNMSVF